MGCLVMVLLLGCWLVCWLLVARCLRCCRVLLPFLSVSVLKSETQRLVQSSGIICEIPWVKLEQKHKHTHLRCCTAVITLRPAVPCRRALSPFSLFQSSRQSNNNQYSVSYITCTSRTVALLRLLLLLFVVSPRCLLQCTIKFPSQRTCVKKKPQSSMRYYTTSPHDLLRCALACSCLVPLFLGM
jgi:hypothetical protein